MRLVDPINTNIISYQRVDRQLSKLWLVLCLCQYFVCLLFCMSPGTCILVPDVINIRYR